MGLDESKLKQTLELKKLPGDHWACSSSWLDCKNGYCFQEKKQGKKAGSSHILINKNIYNFTTDMAVSHKQQLEFGLAKAMGILSFQFSKPKRGSHNSLPGKEEPPIISILQRNSTFGDSKRIWYSDCTENDPLSH